MSEKDKDQTGGQTRIGLSGADGSAEVTVIGVGVEAELFILEITSNEVRPERGFRLRASKIDLEAAVSASRAPLLDMLSRLDVPDLVYMRAAQERTVPDASRHVELARGAGYIKRQDNFLRTSANVRRSQKRGK